LPVLSGAAWLEREAADGAVEVAFGVGADLHRLSPRLVVKARLTHRLRRLI
jgi:hypothetical protein